MHLNASSLVRLELTASQVPRLLTRSSSVRKTQAIPNNSSSIKLKPSGRVLLIILAFSTELPKTRILVHKGNILEWRVVKRWISNKSNPLNTGKWATFKLQISMFIRVIILDSRLNHMASLLLWLIVIICRLWLVLTLEHFNLIFNSNSTCIKFKCLNYRKVMIKQTPFLSLLHTTFRPRMPDNRFDYTQVKVQITQTVTWFLTQPNKSEVMNIKVATLMTALLLQQAILYAMYQASNQQPQPWLILINLLKSRNAL